MKEKIISLQAKRVSKKYDSFSEFSKNASKKDKKIVMEAALYKANRLQKQLLRAKSA